MKISKYLHSCVLIEESGEKLLIDPGAFSFIENRITPDIFKGINVVVFTHNHQDHFDKGALEVIVRNNPGVKIISNSDTLNQIRDFENIIELEDGEQQLGAFKIKGFFAAHEAMRVPMPKNTAYIINDTVLHPGDSLSSVIAQHNVKVLAVPVAGSWVTRISAMDFAEDFKPQIIFPIHDVHIKDFFAQWDYGAWQKGLAEKGIGFRPLAEPGDSFEV